MNILEAIGADTALNNSNPIAGMRENHAANVFSHPNRASMGQTLAGNGALVFEGELLEMPLKWHPTGTAH